MRNRVLILGSAAATGIVLTVCIGAVPRPAASSEDAAVVNELHYLLDRRFQTIDGVKFGINRIPVTPEHPGILEWKPEREEEQQVSTRLMASGQSVVLMVANAHGPLPDRWTVVLESLGMGKPVARTFIGGLAAYEQPPSGIAQAISKPVLLTGNKPPVPLPTFGQLSRGVRGSVAAFKAEGSYEFPAGGWIVHARPIRASKTACLNCHAKSGASKVGELLGVALYAFER